MKQGMIKIEATENGYFQVKAELYNGNAWLASFQIAELFGVYNSTIQQTLKRLYKNGLLNEHEVKRNCEVIRRNKDTTNCRKSYVDLYNLEAILMLSYHLSSIRAGVFRKWIQTQLKESLQTKELPQVMNSMLFYTNEISN